MRLEQIRGRFQKLAEERNVSYFLGAPAADNEIAHAELRLGVSFPAQVNLFYRTFNGIRVDDPPLDVFELERIEFSLTDRLQFAVVDSMRPLYFDTSHSNQAEQWDIVAGDGYVVTLTMASFWSNKIWAWMEKRRPIWQAERFD